MSMHLRRGNGLYKVGRSWFSNQNDMKTIMREVIPIKQKELNEVKAKYGNLQMGEVTVNQALGGMRGVCALFYDQSTVDPIQGVKMRGYSIQEMYKLLPKAKTPIEKGYCSTQQPMAESAFFLLLTGRMPTDDQAIQLRNEWEHRGKLSQQSLTFIDKLDTHMHAMTILNLAILNEQQHSSFARIYDEGKITKQDQWEHVYEDSMDVLAKLPFIISAIYRKKFRPHFTPAPPPIGIDWTQRFSHLMGFGANEQLNECLRAFMTVHADHEGGEVTTHASHLAASALSDPYLSISNAYAGIAGPLHGLTNQEVLKWILNFIEVHGFNATDKEIEDYVATAMDSGKLVPGYGHAVLRTPDIRFLHFYDFAERHMKDNQMVKLLHRMTEIIPQKLKTYPNIKNPYPNVDAHSGTLLYELGFKQYTFYTCLFAMSRTMGCLSNLIWSRAYGLPIERPESADLAYYRHILKPELEVE